MPELVDYYREGDKDGKYSTRVVMHTYYVIVYVHERYRRDRLDLHYH